MLGVLWCKVAKGKLRDREELHYIVFVKRCCSCRQVVLCSVGYEDARYLIDLGFVVPVLAGHFAL